MKLDLLHFEMGDEMSITTCKGHNITVRYDTDGRLTVSDERMYGVDDERLYRADENAQVLCLDAETGWEVHQPSSARWPWIALSIVMRTMYSKAPTQFYLTDPPERP